MRKDPGGGVVTGVVIVEVFDIEAPQSVSVCSTERFGTAAFRRGGQAASTAVETERK